MKNKCCEKCSGIGQPVTWKLGTFCEIPSCNCHQEAKAKFLAGVFLDETEPVWEDWEEQFLNDFGYLQQKGEPVSGAVLVRIRLLLEEKKEEGYKLAEKDFKEDHKVKYDSGFEAGKLSVHSKDGAAWDAGREAGQKDGYQKGFEDGRKGFEYWVEEGKKEATVRLIALAEGMKRDCVNHTNHEAIECYGYDENYNGALEAFIKLVSKED